MPRRPSAIAADHRYMLTEACRRNRRVRMAKLRARRRAAEQCAECGVASTAFRCAGCGAENKERKVYAQERREQADAA